MRNATMKNTTRNRRDSQMRKGGSMRNKEDLKKLADTYREIADIIDEMTNSEDPEKEEELAGKFLVKLLKIQSIQERL